MRPDIGFCPINENSNNNNNSLIQSWK